MQDGKRKEAQLLPQEPQYKTRSSYERHLEATKNHE
jgi:hypothetical protein